MNKQEFIDKYIAIARTWKGTPWRHNQKKKGGGTDCVRFLEQVALEADYRIEPLPDKYVRQSKKNAIANYLNRNFKKVERQTPLKGDILLFNGSGLYNHVGFCTGDNQVIHANQKEGKVTEHSIDGVWQYMLDKGGIWEVKTWE